MPRTEFQSSPSNKMESVEVEYSAEEAAFIRQCAADEGMTEGEFLRAMNQTILKDHGRSAPEGSIKRIFTPLPKVIPGFPFFQPVGTPVA